MKKLIYILAIAMMMLPSEVFADSRLNDPGIYKIYSKEIHSENDLLDMDNVVDKINIYQILEKEQAIRATICWKCGRQGLTTSTIYKEHGFSSIPCPIVGWATGKCQLSHFKVFSGVKCTYCGFEETGIFLHDKVKSICNEDGGGMHWVIPNKNHESGIDVHECPCSKCTNVYYYLSGIVNLK